MKHFAKATIAVLLTLVCQLGAAPSATAQLDADPAALPIPSIFAGDPGRAVVVSVMFNSATEVVEQQVIVANTRARGSIADPPLIRLELLDDGGTVLSEQNAWHPLWTTDWDETGDTETGLVLTSGAGTFYVALREDLAAVRITDIELGMELLTVDVATEIGAFCTTHPALLICGGTGVTSTTTTLAATTTTTVPGAGDGCADPVGNGGTARSTAPSGTAIVTASDALFVLGAAVGLQSCQLCICDVNGSGTLTATDALATLNAAVGLQVTLSCPPCT